MKNLLCIVVLVMVFSLTFSGKSEVVDTSSLKIRLSVTSPEDSHIATAMKGHLLEELHKIPDVKTVEEIGTENYRIDVLVLETKPSPGLAYSVCILLRFNSETLMPFIQEKDKGVVRLLTDVVGSGLYYPQTQLIGTCGLTRIQASCKELVAKINNSVLEPVRQGPKELEKVSRQLENLKYQLNNRK